MGVRDKCLIIQITPDVASRGIYRERAAFPRERRGALPAGRPAHAYKRRERCLADTVDGGRIRCQRACPSVDVGNRQGWRELPDPSVYGVAHVRIEAADAQVAEIVVQVVELRDHTQKPLLLILSGSRRSNDCPREEIGIAENGLPTGDADIV